jgi:putative MATE family efflux protein
VSVNTISERSARAVTTSGAPSRAPAERAAAAAPTTGAARTRLLLEGPIVSTLMRLAAPNVVVNVVLISVTAGVDAHFVGRLGPSVLAGLSLVFPLLMLMQQMANSSMGSAVASAISRAIGSGRSQDASALVVHALLIAAGMAAIFSTLMLVGGPSFYALMGGSGTTLSAAVEYSNTIFAGALVYWLLSTLTSIVRGTGQAGVLAVVYVAAELLHIVLVPALVFGFGPIPAFGITGAGLATVISFSMSTLMLAWYLASGRTALRLSLRDVRLDRRLFKDILRVGAPMSLQPVVNNLTLATLTAFVATLGPTALAGFGVAVRLEYFQIPLTFGLGAAVVAMVGTNLGASRTARAERIAWTAAGLAAGVTALIGLLAVTMPRLWIVLFTAAPDVQDQAATYLAIAGLSYPFFGAAMMLSSAFQAAGRPAWPLLSITTRSMIVVAGGFISLRVVGSSLAGLGVAAALGLFAFAVVLTIAFHTGRWKSAKSR